MKAELIDSMGDDLRVVNAARVSFSKESDYIKPGDRVEFEEFNDWDDPKFKEHLEYVTGREIPIHTSFEHIVPIGNKLNAKDVRLVKYLARHNHWTPFSHPMITMRETVPIFVARQRFKHMVGFTYNEVSRRYVDDEPEFFFPQWRSKPDGSIKQGSGNVIPRDDTETLDYIEDYYAMALSQCRESYNNLLGLGVAPEQARMVLPQSMYTSYYVTGSLAAWARAYTQRIDPHAQEEIRNLAKQWDDIIRPLFPVSWEALVD